MVEEDKSKVSNPVQQVQKTWAQWDEFSKFIGTLRIEFAKAYLNNNIPMTIKVCKLLIMNLDSRIRTNNPKLPTLIYGEIKLVEDCLGKAIYFNDYNQSLYKDVETLYYINLQIERIYIAMHNELDRMGFLTPEKKTYDAYRAVEGETW